MPRSTPINRRTLLRTSLGLGLGLAAAPLLTACGDGGAAEKSAAKSRKVLPSTVTANTVKADLPGTAAGVPNAFYSYPKTPARSVQGAPLKGAKTVKAFTETYAPPAPARGRNTAWQAIEKRLGGTVDITAVAADDYPAKFSTMVAGGELADVFMYPESGGVDHKAAFLAAECADLTPFLSGDKVKAYPNLAAIPASAWQQALYGDKLYGVPVTRYGTSGSKLLPARPVQDGRGRQPRPDHRPGPLLRGLQGADAAEEEAVRDHRGRHQHARHVGRRALLLVDGQEDRQVHRRPRDRRVPLCRRDGGQALQGGLLLPRHPRHDRRPEGPVHGPLQERQGRLRLRRHARLPSALQRLRRRDGRHRQELRRAALRAGRVEGGHLDRQRHAQRVLREEGPQGARRADPATPRLHRGALRHRGVHPDQLRGGGHRLQARRQGHPGAHAHAAARTSASPGASSPPVSRPSSRRRRRTR